MRDDTKRCSGLGQAGTAHRLGGLAHAAAHDLRSPLQTMSTLAQFLEARYGGSLDDQAHQCLQMMQKAAADMRRLIDGLVAFADAGIMEPPAETTSAKAALAKALARLGAQIQASGAAVTCTPLPHVAISQQALADIFEILITNALTYRGAAPPEIKVSAVPDGAFQRFSVTDNGIGIEPQYHEVVFAPLKRLHGYDIPGSGLGLSIATCLVERHGGRLRLESEPGRGATFSFTLPAECHE